MKFGPFSLSRLPRVEFGPGAVSRVPSLCARYGKRLLLVTGARSFRASENFLRLADLLRGEGFAWDDLVVTGEPSPQLVDQAVADFRGRNIQVVLGVGGGSALDTAKAVAGLLHPGNSVLDHLEGVGPEAPYRGPPTPFVAVPTTAGTGSEATKNAVLSVRRKGGFKKSFRDDKLVASFAVLDPNLLSGCPRDLVAAEGMDALTQLLEAYVSVRAGQFSDSVARGGLEAVRAGLLSWYEKGSGSADAAESRAAMMYAAFASGVALSHAGLGAVHGLASPLGAFHPVPHGVACGTLVAAVTEANINAMLSHDPTHAALGKYADAGRVVTGRVDLDDASARRALVDWLYEATDALKLPRLRAYSVAKTDIPEIVAACRAGSMKTNPVVLTDDELTAVLVERT
ncbi:MAG: iron-containing alcohol dehydrogenase [Deltaproteobacteria bacterium]|nr:iron-containing alcohol dehydrogenase [Deltaproteobacteria bacterium]